jgi:hypothetical protein
MKNYRVTIKHSAGDQPKFISTVVPSNDGWQAIIKVKNANSIEDANVLSVKAELLKTN